VPPIRPVLPELEADLVLLHAPAIFDFRGRRDLYFPFLSTSGDVPITPLYEYFPVGFKSLERFLGARGHRVRLLNLASLLLRFPALDADSVLSRLRAPLVGIDLHWMVHVQGALEVAARLRRIHPEQRIVFGGLSATRYAHELVHDPAVDMVLRGYDTHEPLHALLEAERRGRGLERVPNLLWKDSAGRVHDNGMSHLPHALTSGVDWSAHSPASPSRGLPIRELISVQTAGCAFDCPWCGGSRSAFRRIHGCDHSLALKPLGELQAELGSIPAVPTGAGFHLYAAGSYNEPEARLHAFLDMVERSAARSVSIEQRDLPSDALLQRMVRACRTTITLSPQSHDLRVARRAGRGVYTPEQMEAWIERALARGIHGIEIWYFVGMPEQDEREVLATVEQCRRLLRRFGGRQVVPMICPMIPLLDPGSTLFEDPATHGYRLFFRSLQEHRQGMTRASLVNRLNYETRWLSRAELIRVGYRAAGAVLEARAEAGAVPRSLARRHVEAIEDALAFLPAVTEADDLVDPSERARALEALGDEIERRNDTVLFGGVANQAFPLLRRPEGRWFDELGWPLELLEEATAATSA
jgi:clorobiocin biosynthesis protein CloN6